MMTMKDTLIPAKEILNVKNLIRVSDVTWVSTFKDKFAEQDMLTPISKKNHLYSDMTFKGRAFNEALPFFMNFIQPE